MFHALFISGSRNFALHFHFRCFARATFNRNLDSLSLRVHSSHVVCRLCLNNKKTYLFEKKMGTTCVSKFKPVTVNCFSRFKAP